MPFLNASDYPSVESILSWTPCNLAFIFILIWSLIYFQGLVNSSFMSFWVFFFCPDVFNFLFELYVYIYIVYLSAFHLGLGVVIQFCSADFLAETL